MRNPRPSTKGDSQGLFDQAMESLRSEDQLRVPSPDQERVLYERVSQDRGRRRPTSILKWAASALFALGLSGSTLAMIGGLPSVKQWWYSVFVDGELIEDVVDGDAERRLQFRMEDGCQVTVLIRRESQEGDVKSGIQVIRDGPDGMQQDVELVQFREATPIAFESIKSLEGAVSLHSWTSRQGRSMTLYLKKKGDLDPGHQLLQFEAGAPEEACVRVIADGIEELGPSSSIEVLEHEGLLEITLDDGAGNVFCTRLSDEAQGEDWVPSYVAPDGKIRVEMNQ